VSVHVPVAVGSLAPGERHDLDIRAHRWNVLVAPYLMGAAMSGATTVRGVEVDVDMSASDVFSNLQFGAMGIVVARKGAWGFGSDLIWMALGTTVRDTNVDFNQGAFAFYGGSHRRLDARVLREPEVIVRGEVDSGRRMQRAPQPLLFERSHPRIYATPERPRRFWTLVHVRTRAQRR